MGQKLPDIRINKFLSEHGESLPHGRISKKVCGIGATQKEIEDKSRNSIIVCPTRHLAATKAIKHDLYYFGSEYDGIESAPFDIMIARLKMGDLIKIMIVADTFVNMYPRFKDYLHLFFVMFDEIDYFQSDSNYRPSLETCIEYYFKLDPLKRNMISATYESSDYELIEEEPHTEVIVAGTKTPQIEAMYVQGSIEKKAAERITSLLNTKQTSDKIIVAFNSIEGINAIISLFKEDISDKIGILCSQSSYSKIKEKQIAKLENGKLQHDLTFMTCAFFAGIDIEENASIIIIADTRYEHSILPVSKIYQIYGRVREDPNNGSGIKKALFLFNCFTKYKGRTLDSVKDLIRIKIDLIEASVFILKKDQRLTNKSHLEDAIEEVISDNTYVNVKLMRNDNQELKINYLNIDYLLHRQNAINEIYTEPEGAFEALKTYFEVKKTTAVLSPKMSNSEIDSIKTRKEQILQEKIRMTLGLIDNFTPYGWSDEKETIKDKYQENIISLLHFLRGEKFFSGNGLDDLVIDNLKWLVQNKYDDNTRLKYYWVQLVACVPSNPNKSLWALLKKNFKDKDQHTSEDIKSKITKLIPELNIMLDTENIFHKKVNKKQATEILHVFFETSIKRKMVNGKTTVYRQIIGKRGIGLAERK